MDPGGSKDYSDNKTKDIKTQNKKEYIHRHMKTQNGWAGYFGESRLLDRKIPLDSTVNHRGIIRFISATNTTAG